METRLVDRRPTARWGRSAAPAAATGRLHLWFPTPHARRKALAWLADAAMPHVAAPGVVAVALDAAHLGDVAGVLARVLTGPEREQTRALFRPDGCAPAAADVPRVVPLERLALAAASGWLVRLLAERRVTVSFQPIVRAAEPADVVGHEALLRGVTAAGRSIAPARMFDVAAGCGLLGRLDALARRAAIAAAATRPTGALWVNLCVASVLDPATCLRPMVEAIDRAGLARGRIVVELTGVERTADVEHLKRIVDFCRRAGARVALDDVGAGPASLHLLHRLRPDIIKLDLELVRGVTYDSYKSLVAEMLLGVAARLGVESVAEGVETPEELAWVRAHGTTYVQGFLTGPPTPA